MKHIYNGYTCPPTHKTSVENRKNINTQMKTRRTHLNNTRSEPQHENKKYYGHRHTNQAQKTEKAHIVSPMNTYKKLAFKTCVRNKFTMATVWPMTHKANPENKQIQNLLTYERI